MLILFHYDVWFQDISFKIETLLLIFKLDSFIQHVKFDLRHLPAFKHSEHHKKARKKVLWQIILFKFIIFCLTIQCTFWKSAMFMHFETTWTLIINIKCFNISAHCFYSNLGIRLDDATVISSTFRFELDVAIAKSLSSKWHESKLI